MQIGPGSTRNPGNDEESDSITYFERELAQTIEDSINESLDDDDDDDHTEEEEDAWSE
tara:strand:+ start:466 stop:639 length:174 start_codon:yes stop_codon:yes gene_type:complete